MLSALPRFAPEILVRISHLIDAKPFKKHRVVDQILRGLPLRPQRLANVNSARGDESAFSKSPHRSGDGRTFITFLSAFAAPEHPAGILVHKVHQ